MNEDVIKNKITKKNIKENLSIIILICVCILSVLLNTFVVQLADVNGDSMQPTLQDGQLLLVSKTHRATNDYNRGDIVIFKEGNRFLIKRIIALPNETVQIIDNDIYINDKKINDFVDVQMDNVGVLSEKITLKDDEYICLGDNRNNSADSREFGPVKQSNMVGKVIFRFLPMTTF